MKAKELLIKIIENNQELMDCPSNYELKETEKCTLQSSCIRCWKSALKGLED